MGKHTKYHRPALQDKAEIRNTIRHILVFYTFFIKSIVKFLRSKKLTIIFFVWFVCFAVYLFLCFPCILWL